MSNVTATPTPGVTPTPKPEKPIGQIRKQCSLIVEGKEQFFKRGDEQALAKALTAETYFSLYNRGALAGDWGYKNG